MGTLMGGSVGSVYGQGDAPAVAPGNLPKPRDPGPAGGTIRPIVGTLEDVAGVRVTLHIDLAALVKAVKEAGCDISTVPDLVAKAKQALEA